MPNGFGRFWKTGRVSASRPSPAEMAIDQIGRNEAAERLMVVLAPMVFDGPSGFCPLAALCLGIGTTKAGIKKI